MAIPEKCGSRETGFFCLKWLSLFHYESLAWIDAQCWKRSARCFARRRTRRVDIVSDYAVEIESQRRCAMGAAEMGELYSYAGERTIFFHRFANRTLFRWQYVVTVWASMPGASSKNLTLFLPLWTNFWPMDIGIGSNIDDCATPKVTLCVWWVY